MTACYCLHYLEASIENESQWTTSRLFSPEKGAEENIGEGGFPVTSTNGKLQFKTLTEELQLLRCVGYKRD